MKKLMLMIALLTMSYAFTACTDPVEEMENGFEIDQVVAVDGDGESTDPDDGPIGG